MSRPDQIAWPRLWIDGHAHSRCAIRGRDSRSRALLRLNADTKRCFESRSVFGHHQRNFEFIQPLGRHRKADQTAAVLRHKVNRIGRDLFCCDRQIAFVFPVFVVGHDYHSAIADGGNGVLDTVE